MYRENALLCWHRIIIKLISLVNKLVLLEVFSFDIYEVAGFECDRVRLVTRACVDKAFYEKPVQGASISSIN